MIEREEDVCALDINLWRVCVCGGGGGGGRIWVVLAASVCTYNYTKERINRRTSVQF